jgi:hypothetical protein
MWPTYYDIILLRARIMGKTTYGVRSNHGSFWTPPDTQNFDLRVKMEKRLGTGG